MIRLHSVHFMNPPVGYPSVVSGRELYFDASIQCVLAGDDIIPVHNVRKMVRHPDFKAAPEEVYVSEVEMKSDGTLSTKRRKK